MHEYYKRLALTIYDFLEWSEKENRISISCKLEEDDVDLTKEEFLEYLISEYVTGNFLMEQGSDEVM